MIGLLLQPRKQLILEVSESFTVQEKHERESFEAVACGPAISSAPLVLLLLIRDVVPQQVKFGAEAWRWDFQPSPLPLLSASNIAFASVVAGLGTGTVRNMCSAGNRVEPDVRAATTMQHAGKLHLLYLPATTLGGEACVVMM